MPRIPLASFTPSATPSSAVRGDMGMFDGVAAGQRALAAGISSIGGAVNDFAQKKQEAVNYATAADADRKMKQAFSDYQEEMKTNGDDKTYLPKWQERQAALVKDLEVDKMSPVLRSQMDSQVKDWQQATTQNVRAIATAREIGRAASNLEASSMQDFMDGNDKEAVEKIDGGVRVGLYSAEKANELKKQQSNSAAYAKYNRTLSDLGELPPAARATELAKLEAKLSERNAKGRPTTDVMEDANGVQVGGLGDPARTDLIQSIRSKQKAAGREMENEMRRLFTVRMGADADEFNRQAAKSFQGGLIDVETTAKGFGFNTYGDEGNSAAGKVVDEMAAGVGLDLANTDQAKKIRDQKSKDFFIGKQNEARGVARNLVDGIPNGKTTTEDVSFALKSGKIDERTAKDLTASLKAHGELSVIKRAIGFTYSPETLSKAMSKYAEMTPQQKDSIDFDDRKKMLAGIDADKDISEEAKAVAMKTYLDAMNVDLQGWPKNGKAQRPHFNGRKLTETEVMVRAEIGETYKKASNIGKGWAGTSMIQDEMELEAFFDSGTYQDNEANQRKAIELLNKTKLKINNLAASRVTAELFAR